MFFINFHSKVFSCLKNIHRTHRGKHYIKGLTKKSNKKIIEHAIITIFNSNTTTIYKTNLNPTYLKYMSMREQQKKKGGGLIIIIISKEQRDIVLSYVINHQRFTNYERISEKLQVIRNKVEKKIISVSKAIRSGINDCSEEELIFILVDYNAHLGIIGE